MEEPQVFIDVADVPELRAYHLYRDRLELGANMTLSELLKLFSAIANENPLMFGYFQVLANHINLVASPSVRNVIYSQFKITFQNLILNHL
jgi:CO/xanthine dehydrogenase FAD-binding subunit